MTPTQYKSLRQTIGTQSHVATLLGVSRPTIARRESDKGKVTKEAEMAIRELAKTNQKETI